MKEWIYPSLFNYSSNIPDKFKSQLANYQSDYCVGIVTWKNINKCGYFLYEPKYDFKCRSYLVQNIYGSSFVSSNPFKSKIFSSQNSISLHWFNLKIWFKEHWGREIWFCDPGFEKIFTWAYSRIFYSIFLDLPTFRKNVIQLASIFLPFKIIPWWSL